jgi:signal transduction histidine kinase
LAGRSAPLGASLVVAVAQTIAVVGIPLTLSLVVASRRDERDSARREAQALRREGTAARREHEALVAAAVAGERTAMARDLHDIAAHHMSGIALLASAMERQIDSNTVAARQSAHDIRKQSTAVLADMRRLVGLLRDESAPTAAANPLDSISDLVEQRRCAGEDVALEDHSAAAGREVGALAQLVGYRMVQEALANAAMHAPGAACTVRLDATAAGFRIRVRNAASVDQLVDGAGSTGADAVVPTELEGQRSGFGLVGMRERANLVGAILQYGSTTDHAWEVDLLLPPDTDYPTGAVGDRDAVGSE